MTEELVLVWRLFAPWSLLPLAAGYDRTFAGPLAGVVIGDDDGHVAVCNGVPPRLLHRGSRIKWLRV